MYFLVKHLHTSIKWSENIFYLIVVLRIYLIKIVFDGRAKAQKSNRSDKVIATQTAISPICHYATRVAVTRNIISSA